MAQKNSIEQILADAKSKIAENGFTTITSWHEDTEVPFSYSVGFARNFNVELYAGPFDPALVRMIFSEVYKVAQHRKKLGACVFTGIFKGGMPLALIPLDESFAAQMNLSRQIHPDEFDALQIVLPDPSGVFPWQEGYDHSATGGRDSGAGVLRLDAQTETFQRYAEGLPEIDVESILRDPSSDPTLH